MPWTAVAGSTFCLRTSPEDHEHLYFVLNDPMDFDGFPSQSCLVVNASTPKGKHDTTCIIPAMCHPFIEHDSFIYFRFARLERAADLEGFLNPPNGLYRPHDPAPTKLVAFILARMAMSPHVSRDYKKCSVAALDKLNGF